jgi:hypothetical protein
VTTGPARIWGSPLFKAGDSDGALERSPALTLGATYAITDRLTWGLPVPAFAYRFGQRGDVELVPRAGLTSIGYSSIEGLLGSLDAGLAVRAWQSPTLSFIAAADVQWEFNTSSTVHRGILTSSASAGLAWEPDARVTVHLAAGGAIPHRTLEASDPAIPLTSTLCFGSIQSLGFRALPLIQLHLSPTLSIDGYASWSVDVHGGTVRDRYLAGLTRAF